MLIKIFFWFFALLALVGPHQGSFNLGAEQIIPVALIKLNGYLGYDELSTTKDLLNQFSSKTLAIEINSTSGELIPLLNIAKKIYTLKLEKNVKVVVYLDENAIGPAAILPFLADELYTSSFVSWGDIPLGSEKIMAANILRNQVTSLISAQNPHGTLLKLIAAAMADPSVQIVDDNGWKAVDLVAKNKNTETVSTSGETLVVNHNQIKALGLITEVLSLEKFYQKFLLKNKSDPESLPAAHLVVSSEYLNPEVEEQLTKHIKYNPNQTNLVGLITIDDRSNGINESTWLYVKKALDYYKEIKPIFIILELNTPGGEVYAAQKISDGLKDLDIQANIPVVAFINNWAISAGAMLAYSCRFIAVVKDASMGAAEPVLAGESGELKAASEKVNSAIRTDFANRARFFERNPYIAEKMVDKDIILVMRHGKIMKLDSEAQIRTVGTEPDLLISPKGKLLTLNAEELIQYGIAYIMLAPAKLAAITQQEEEKGKWPAQKMLLFQSPFFSKIDDAIIDVYRMDWKTKFFVLLATPFVSSLLILGLMAGVYMELSHPGFGLPGSIALVCLFLITLSSLSLQIANWLELILLLTGMAIIFTELFLLPTFGLLGFIGILFFLAGLLGMLIPEIGAINFDFSEQTLNTAGEAALKRLAWFCGTFVLGILLIMFLARFVTPSFATYSRLVLKGNEQEGYIAGIENKLLPPVGSLGVVLATLRPGGKVLINSQVYDAISTGGFIEKETAIVVVRVEESTMIVDVETKET